LKYLQETIAEWKKPIPTEYTHKPLVIAGPSGVGKARLIKALLRDYSKYFTKVVTHTTRKPRIGEIGGIDYHFIDSIETYNQMKINNEFLEYNQVHDNYYGISFKAYNNVTSNNNNNTNKIAILEIDVQGIQVIKEMSEKLNIQPYYIFIAPSDINLLRERLIERGTETETEINLRLKNAQHEITTANIPEFVDNILINNDFSETTTNFFRLIRNFYPMLPNPGRIRYLQREWKRIANRNK